MVSFRTSSWQRTLQDFATQLLNFVFPPTCVSCKKVGTLLCADCATQIEWLHAPVCARCGQPVVKSETLCAGCTTRPSPLTRARAAVFYAGPIATMIHGLKYRNQFALAAPLAEMMATAWLQWSFPPAIVIPIPLHAQREKKRGYNQAALLARRFAQIVDLPYADDLLVRCRHTDSQVELDAAARQENVAGAFIPAVTPLPRQPVLLIDDVYTTGATMNAAAQALQAAGVPAVYGYCLARAAHGQSRADVSNKSG